MSQFMNISKRFSLATFPIPFDHPYTFPTLVVAVTASSLLLCYLQVSQRNALVETERKRCIKERSKLERPEKRYASLMVNKQYVNPFNEWQEIPFWNTVLFWLRRWKGNGVPKSAEELRKHMPVQQPALDIIFPTRDHDVLSTANRKARRQAAPGISFTWFGQSTCLITVDGLTILTDPVFTRCSINDYLGPQRLRPIPCQLDDIQHFVDIVLVSHDHFDHLDEKVVHKLGNEVAWYVPFGLKSWFTKRGVNNVIELDWWQETGHKEYSDVHIACVPAMHWSGSRTPFDKNGSLWCSYVIKVQDRRVFFCGDTGYSPELFKAIGNKFAPFDFAAMPIGSFKPEFLMRRLHMGPVEAVKAHCDLAYPTLSVGIHWGTFMMSDEHYLDPPHVLKQAWEEHNKTSTLSSALSTFTTLEIGETRTL